MMTSVCRLSVLLNHGIGNGDSRKGAGLNKLFVPLPNHSAIHQEEKRYGSYIIS